MMRRVALELPESFSFSTEIEVRVTDLNYGGHLGNDTVLSLLQEARARYFASLGYTELDIEGVGTVVVDAEISYRGQGFGGDVLRIAVQPAEPSGHGFSLYYLAENEAKGVEIARARTGICFFDYGAQKVTRMPDAFRAASGLGG
jgi:4-hydroxybenzoyl-CoA thioesterase